jgi:hypothetical protein
VEFREVLLVRQGRRKEETRTDVIRSEWVLDLDLLGDRRHPGPVVEDMGHTMSTKAVEIIRLKAALVAQLNAAVPSLWNCVEEVIYAPGGGLGG